MASTSFFFCLGVRASGIGFLQKKLINLLEWSGFWPCFVFRASQPLYGVFNILRLLFWATPVTHGNALELLERLLLLLDLGGRRPPVIAIK
jgi:hypothetical protein